MSSLVIIFIVMIAATIISNNVVDSKPSRDLEELLSKLSHQHQNRRKSELSIDDYNKRDDTDSYSDYDDNDDDDDSDDESYDESDDDDDRYGKLRHGDVRELGKGTQHKNKDKYKTDRRNKRRDSSMNQIASLLIPEGNNIQTRILEQLFSKGVSNMEPKSDANVNRRKKRLENISLKSFKVNGDTSDDLKGLENYSKIYIVLDPSAIAKSKSKNKNSLNYLASNILSPVYSKSIKKGRQTENKLPRYKEFFTKENLRSRRARRARRESNERYAPKDSVEDDYKQKWARNDRGSGGGGGRTAIPYIRHRGDIYERDN